MQAGGINLFAAFRQQCITDEGLKTEMEEMDIKYMKQLFSHHSYDNWTRGR